MDWQPIETAPRDGTEIIVGLDFATVWIVHVGFWREVDDDLISLGWKPEETGWWSYTRNSITQEMIKPTHWMPLPEPPK